MSLDDEWDTPCGSGILTTSSENVARSSLRSMNSEYSLETGSRGQTCKGAFTRSVHSLTGSSGEKELEEGRCLRPALLTSCNRDSSDESFVEDRTRGKMLCAHVFLCCLL